MPIPSRRWSSSCHNVGEAEHLAAERVQNKAGDVSILEAVQCACPTRPVLSDDGSNLVEIHELEEQEAVGAHSATPLKT